MDGILLNKKIGIIGGGITGLIVGIFLAKEGHKVSIFEKNTLLSETSSKTTKLLHEGWDILRISTLMKLKMA